MGANFQVAVWPIISTSVQPKNAASLKDINAILALKVHLPTTDEARLIICRWMIHMMACPPERDKVVRWMRAFASVMTANWTTFKDNERSDGQEKSTKGVHLITRTSYEISSYFDDKLQNLVKNLPKATIHSSWTK